MIETGFSTGYRDGKVLFSQGPGAGFSTALSASFGSCPAMFSNRHGQKLIFLRFDACRALGFSPRSSLWAPHVCVQGWVDRSGVSGLGRIALSDLTLAARPGWTHSVALRINLVLIPRPMPWPPPGRAFRCATWHAGSQPASVPAQPWLSGDRSALQSLWPSCAGASHPGFGRR